MAAPTVDVGDGATLELNAAHRFHDGILPGAIAGTVVAEAGGLGPIVEGFVQGTVHHLHEAVRVCVVVYRAVKKK